MKNKGFSMVELIIVIAIMAILAGALAPMLVKYINKSKLSSDITNGREIAAGIMAAVTDDDARDDASDHALCHPLNSMDASNFKAAVFDYVGLDPTQNYYGKSKRDADNSTFVNKEFYYTLDQTKNRVQVYYGVPDDPDYQIYPVTGKKLLKQQLFCIMSYEILEK